MAIKKVNHLEIEEEADEIKPDSFARTLGIIFLFVIVLCGALGLTGSSGFFTHKQIVSEDGQIKINYAAIGRFQVSDQIEITLSPNIISGSKLTIAFNSDYLKNFYVKQILSKPNEIKAYDNKIVFTFPVNPQDHPLTIYFLMEPGVSGFLSARIDINNAYRILFKQFVFH